MKRLINLFSTAGLTVCLFLAIQAPVLGGIMEVGDLNIIDDVGNASDGLRFLDMSYSVGRTQADALANARVIYSNARLATVAEWENLFLAAGILTSHRSVESRLRGGAFNRPCRLCHRSL